MAHLVYYFIHVRPYKISPFLVRRGRAFQTVRNPNTTEAAFWCYIHISLLTLVRQYVWCLIRQFLERL